MLEETHPLLMQEIIRLAGIAIGQAPDETATIDAAVAILERNDVLPPSREANTTAYTVHDGQAYALDVKPSGIIGECTCGVYPKLCAHRAAVRLYIQSHAALQALFEEDPPLEASLEPVDEHPVHRVLYPEMPFSINTFITVHGRRCQVTVRSTDDHAGLARFEAILARYPEPKPAISQAEEETAEEPVAMAEPRTAVDTTTKAPVAPREDWCEVHQAQMRHNERGWAHKVADGLWCSGHWCHEHNTRFWENTSRDGKNTYFSHALQPKGSGTCYEEKKAGRV